MSLWRARGSSRPAGHAEAAAACRLPSRGCASGGCGWSAGPGPATATRRRSAESRCSCRG